MKKLKFHGKMTKRQFWIEWFGLNGREVGTKKAGFHRKFIDNPIDFLDFIDETDKEHEEGEFCRPCWTTVLVYRRWGKPVAIDRVFYDFDDDKQYCSKCKKYYKKKKHRHETIVKPRKDKIAQEVIHFLDPRSSSRIRGTPLIVETYKGYHVHLFTDKIYMIDEKIVKRVYDHLKRKFTQDKSFEFMDSTVKKDIKRLSRVPLTRHEKTGEVCRIVKMVKTFNEQKKHIGYKLVEDKVRGIDSYYKTSSSIGEEMVNKSIIAIREENKMMDYKEELKKEKSIPSKNGNGFQGTIRPCFQKRLDAGYMPHQMRLAFLMEAYFSGFTTLHQLVNFFKNFEDYKEDQTLYQVQYFLEHKPSEFPPYRCKTIHGNDWCIGKECPFYEKKIQNI